MLFIDNISIGVYLCINIDYLFVEYKNYIMISICYDSSNEIL